VGAAPGGTAPDAEPGGPLRGSDGLRPLAAAVVVNAAAGTLFAWSILLAPVRAEFGVGPADLAPVFSTALVGFTLAVLAGGHLVDRLDPRRVVTAAGLLAGAGLVTGAVAPTVLVLTVGLGALFGSGSGFIYSAAVTATSLRDGRRRGRAVGAVVAAYAAGPVIAGPLGASGVEQVGWRPTLLLAAIGVAALVVVAGRGLQGGPAARRAGLVPAPGGGSGSAPLAWLWLLFLCAVAPALFAFAFAADIATAAGASPSAAGGVVALMAGGNLFGRIAAGPLSDRVGVPAALRVVVVAQLVSLPAPGWSTDPAVVLTGLALLAVAYGAASALLPLATVDLVAPSRFGVSYGRVFTSWGVAGVLGPVAGAALAGGAGGHATAFRAALAVAGLAAVALIGLERSLAQQRAR
jgi:OFA family oxalate/formate antiporter-like MFS transporter